MSQSGSSRGSIPSSGNPSPWYLTGNGTSDRSSPVDHQVIEVDDSARSVIVAVVLGVVAEVLIGHVDLVPVGLVVAQFVDGVGDGVGFDDEEERRVGAAEFQEPGLAEPAIGVDHGDVGQVVVVELAGCGDLSWSCSIGEGVHHTLLGGVGEGRPLAAGEVGSDSGNHADFMVVGIATALGQYSNSKSRSSHSSGLSFMVMLHRRGRLSHPPRRCRSVTLRTLISQGIERCPKVVSLLGNRLDRHGSRRALGRLSLSQE